MLLRTQSAIDECENHLNRSDAWNTEVESYLTQYILVILSADIQQSVYVLLNNRVTSSSSPDLGLKSFAYAMGVKCLRSFSKSDLSKFLALFGEDVKRSFNAELDDRVVTIYNNALLNRHEVAHKAGGTTTFRELRDIYAASVKVLQAIDVSLNVIRPAVEEGS